MKVVKFIKPMSGYRVDNAASFDDKVADKIIDAGYGEEIAIEDTKLSKKKDAE